MSKFFFSSIFALAALSLVLAGPLWAADEPGEEQPAAVGFKHLLKYQFEPGEVLRTEIVHRATVQTTIQGNSQTAETHSKSIKSWEVTDVTDKAS